MLGDAELDAMRSTAGAALPDSAVVKRLTTVSDGGGGKTTTWAAAGTTDCRLAPLIGQGTEQESGDRVAPDSPVVVTLPHDADVAEEDRLEIGDATYSVVTIRRRSWNLTCRVEAREVV